MMLEKKHFARASALLSVAQNGSTILAPVIAAILIATIGIGGIFILDAASFLVAVGTLLGVSIPQPPATELGRRSHGNIFQEAGFSFRYILRIPSLLGLQLTFFFGNLLSIFGMVLMTPMILARTADSTAPWPPCKQWPGSVVSLVGSCFPSGAVQSAGSTA